MDRDLRRSVGSVAALRSIALRGGINFKKQLDYAVWAILFIFGRAVVVRSAN